jgi:hypothetical protein
MNFSLVLDPAALERRTRAMGLRLDAHDIAKADVASALDAIRKLRPALLSPDMQGCLQGDSLALYVNGMRRPTIDPMPTSDEQARMQQDSLATARAGRVGAALAWMDSAPAQSGRQDRRKHRLGVRTSTDYAMAELQQIPANAVALIRYSGCSPADPEIRLRNVIWVELKDGRGR